MTTKTLTYDQLRPGKRYRATVEAEATVSAPGVDIRLRSPCWGTATYEEIPEPPKPLAVGDRVDTVSGKGVIKAIDRDFAWVSFAKFNTTHALSDITRIEGEGWCVATDGKDGPEMDNLNLDELAAELTRANDSSGYSSGAIWTVKYGHRLLALLADANSKLSELREAGKALAGAYASLPGAQTAPGSWYSHVIALIGDDE